MNVDWQGVYPAVTTQFRSDQSLDLEATRAHVEMLVRSGMHGLQGTQHLCRRIIVTECRSNIQ